MLGQPTLDDLIITRVTDYYKHKSDRDRLLTEVKDGAVENFITTLVNKHKDDINVKMNVRYVSDDIPGKYFLEGTIRDVSVEVLAQHLREQAELELKTEKKNPMHLQRGNEVKHC